MRTNEEKRLKSFVQNGRKLRNEEEGKAKSDKKPRMIRFIADEPRSMILSVSRRRVVCVKAHLNEALSLTF